MLKITAETIQLQKDKDRQAYEARKAAQEKNGISKVSRLRIENDTEYAVKWLHDYEKGVEIFVHLWEGNTPVHKICEVHYGRKCKICETMGSKGKCYAVRTRCMIGWVYNLVGQTFPDRQTGELKPYNPIKRVEVPVGKNDANVSVMQELARTEAFMNKTWRLKRITGQGFEAPKTFKDQAELRKLIGKEVDLELSTQAKKIAGMDQLDLFKLFLTTFQDVDTAALELDGPAEDKPDDIDTVPDDILPF